MPLAEALAEAVEFAGEDAPNVLLAKCGPDMSYLSVSEVEALDESIADNKSLTFGQLKRKSHDAAWAEAHRQLHGSNIISPASMARVIGASPAILEYIEEQQQIDRALR